MIDDSWKISRRVRVLFGGSPDAVPLRLEKDSGFALCPPVRLQENNLSIQWEGPLADPPVEGIVIFVEVVMSQRFEQNRLPPGTLSLFDRERATLHIVFVFGFWSKPFHGTCRIVARMEKSVSDEIMVRGFYDGVIDVPGQFVLIGMLPIIGAIPIPIEVKTGDKIQHRGLCFLIEGRCIILGNLPVFRLVR